MARGKDTDFFAGDAVFEPYLLALRPIKKTKSRIIVKEKANTVFENFSNGSSACRPSNANRQPV
jgi:hypothetical protein